LLNPVVLADITSPAMELVGASDNGTGKAAVR
jgi:hypothetical protein